MRAGVSLVCLALWFACGRAERDRAPAPLPVAPATADRDGRLDPTRYRAQIEAAEALLYSTEGLSDEGWKALSKALLELHNEIVFADVSASAREASNRIFFLSARADAITSGRVSDAELAEFREQWRQLSSEKFAPAEWIRAEPPSRRTRQAD
jgi:hypothetical protein